MAVRADDHERRRLIDLSAKLREATWAALQNRSALARALDESRGEVERLLMLASVDEAECRRVIVRGQMMLDAWQGLAAGMSLRSR